MKGSRRLRLGAVAPYGLFGACLLMACADTKFRTDDGGATGDAIRCKTGENRCNGKSWETCDRGEWQPTENCGEKICLDDLGCRTCVPEKDYCKGQDTYTCNPQGTEEIKTGTCREDQQCEVGMCLDMCDLLQRDRSNVGCEFWAADLPNEYYCQSIDGGSTCMLYGCAACEQFAVVVANTSRFKVGVTIEMNEASPGEPPKLTVVEKLLIDPESLEVFNLPMREVDCSEWKTDGTGKLRRTTDSQTCLSSRAFRIKSTYPIVAYQFNPIINDFSNGASLLIPNNGLDKDYFIMGWPTTNPLPVNMPGFLIEGSPDYMNLTIVGTAEDTKVEVTLAHQIQGSKDGKIPAAKAGETIKATLGPFDVLNLNTIQDMAHSTGDLTGTRVKASKPVVVFSGGQRASVPTSIDTYQAKPPEPSGNYDVCCTEHFEQQMFPISSLGSTFVITRTPIRSTSSRVEPDFYRILATKDDTKIRTTLSNFPSFALKAGDVADFWSTGDFIIEADKPIMIGQFAVAQGFLDSWEGTGGGDPEFVVFPPVEQYRQDYVFLTPPTFDKDYVVIAAPASASIQLDGLDLTLEFSQRCITNRIGQIKGEDFVSFRCPVEDGVHRVVSSSPIGIMVYGYYSVGSYGYPGGADVKQINPIE